MPGPLPAKAVRTVVRTFDLDPRQCPPLGREPLATWRFFSEQASAILRIAADLQRGRLGGDDDWTILLRDGVRPAPSLQARRRCMRDIVGGWLSLGRIKPAINDFSVALTWTGADLFGELAVQLALTIEQIDGCVFCIACGKPYSPKRRVIRHGFNYCPAPACQREAAARRSKEYRDRKRSGSPLGAQNLPYRGVHGGRTNDPLFSE